MKRLQTPNRWHGDRYTMSGDPGGAAEEPEPPPR